MENPRGTPEMKKNIPDRPHEKARSDAVFAEAAKKAEKLSKKVLTSGNRIDIINKQSAMAHKNKSEMLLWLSRQSTSLVRTRSPVRIWLAAPRKSPVFKPFFGFDTGFFILCTDKRGSRRISPHVLTDVGMRLGSFLVRAAVHLFYVLHPHVAEHRQNM